MKENAGIGLGREHYARALAIGGAQRARLPAPAVEALAADVVSLLASRLRPERLDRSPSQAAFDVFVQALLGEDAHKGADLIDRAYASGTPFETIYLAYLARAACELGRLWDEDRLDFLQVTLAVGRLYAIMRGLRAHHPLGLPQDSRRRALFLTMPGDDHRFGAAIAADLFRSRGWDIELEQPVDRAAAVSALEHSDHTLVGVSASQGEQLSELIRLVSALHICRPEAFVLVGGPITDAVPDLLELVDADAIASSAAAAIDRLEELIANQRRGPR